MSIIQRTDVPEPWQDVPNLPWNDIEFSQRMLLEHLSQNHNAASRRTEIIDHHVQWIHQNCLAAKKSKILDITCGPGFYTSGLARLGHQCTGIDFSPASIEYAKAQANKYNLSCDYVLDDVLTANYGNGYDLVILISGQFNTFSPEDGQLILQKIYASLKDGGQLLLEPHNYDSVKRIGQQPSRWSSSKSGLYANTPYLTLKEQAWHENLTATAERYFIIDTASASVDSFVISLQAYTQNELFNMLDNVGFKDTSFYRMLGDDPIALHEDFMAVTAMKK